MNDARGKTRDPLATAWLVLSSERTTAILVIVLAIFAGLTAFIPQGKEALALAVAEDASELHTLAAWGLTDVFESAWIRALAVLLLANILAAIVRTAGAGRKKANARPPMNAPYKVDLVADLPERAVESLHETFRIRLGVPENEAIDGSRVSMVYDTNPKGRIAPMLVHIGLILLVAGAAWSKAPIADSHMIAHAVLEVKDVSTGAVGTFDMMSGEHVQFFRWPGEYSIVDYLPSKDGLGPAVRIQKILQQERRSDDFWIYLRAPAGFDERHRKAEVAIAGVDMGFVPLPGEGFTSSPAALLFLFGFGLFAFGLLSGRGSEGLLWLEADGDRVTITGLPRAIEDKSFEHRFSRWARIAQLAIKEA